MKRAVRTIYVIIALAVFFTVYGTAAQEGAGDLWLEVSRDILAEGYGEGRPHAPEKPVAEPEGPFSAELSWNASSRFIFYFQVMRRKQGEEFFKRVALLDSNAGSYVDKPLDPGAEYEYCIRSVARFGVSGCSPVASVKMPEVERLPEKPSDLKASPVSTSEVALEWKDNSNNEEYFDLQRWSPGEGWSLIARLALDEATYRDKTCEPGKFYRYRIAAGNCIGSSGFSIPEEAETISEELAPQGPPVEYAYTAPVTQVAEHKIKIDPLAGKFFVENSKSPAPRIDIVKAAKTERGFLADVMFTNTNPYSRFDDLRLEIVECSSNSLVTVNSDFGLPGGKVKEGAEKGMPQGYFYRKKKKFPRLETDFMQSTIGPACMGLKKRWELAGEDKPFEIKVRSYARVIPGDFKQDQRFDKNLPLWVLDTSMPLVPDSENAPGSPINAASIPATHVLPGDVIAVSVGIEAGDNMERRAGQEYEYFSRLDCVLTFDSDVVKPLSGLALPDGTSLPSPVSDAGVPGHEKDDGWDMRTAAVKMSDKKGWIWIGIEHEDCAASEPAEKEQDLPRCGREGVMVNGVAEGVDSELEVVLAVIYFQAVGEPGQGTTFTLAPGKKTSIQIKNSNGTPADFSDDEIIDERLSLNPALSGSSGSYGGYQVKEAYICIR